MEEILLNALQAVSAHYDLVQWNHAVFEYNSKFDSFTLVLVFECVRTHSDKFGWIADGIWKLLQIKKSFGHFGNGLGMY